MDMATFASVNVNDVFYLDFVIKQARYQYFDILHFIYLHLSVLKVFFSLHIFHHLTSIKELDGFAQILAAAAVI